jgi:hypothetical protein
MKELSDFLKDLERARDEKSPQFLGAMIVFERQSSVGDPKILEVVDGQQRLTTLTLFICGIISAFCRAKRYSDAARLFRVFVWHNQPVSFGSNLRLHPSRLDRMQFNQIISELLADANLVAELQSPNVTYLAALTEGESKVGAQYKRIRRYIDSQVKESGADVLNELTDTLSAYFTVVTIRLKDPTNCSRIFERLNFRGVPVTTGDLVRNEIFAKMAGKDVVEIEQLNTHVWEPFYKKFQPAQLFNDYFFPYGLVLKSTVTKGEVFSELRNQWAGVSDPNVILGQLAHYQDAFLDYCNNTNNLGLSKFVKRALQNIRASDAPASIYPFVMRLSRAVKDTELDEKCAIEALAVIESYLVRRAVCGVEPTGLHAVFKSLWGSAVSIGDQRQLPPTGRVCGETILQALANHKTQHWADDAEFGDAIEHRELAKTSICKYLLREHEIGVGGDTPSDIPQIEHILPQKISGTEWQNDFTSEKHSRWQHTLANVIPLSSSQNQSLGNATFSEKSHRYREDSMFKSARLVGKEFETWTEKDLQKRASSLAAWAKIRWPKY